MLQVETRGNLVPEVNNLKSTKMYVHKLIIRYNGVKQDSWPMSTSERVNRMRNQITCHFAELNFWCENIN